MLWSSRRRSESDFARRPHVALTLRSANNPERATSDALTRHTSPRCRVDTVALFARQCHSPCHTSSLGSVQSPPYAAVPHSCHLFPRSPASRGIRTWWLQLYFSDHFPTLRGVISSAVSTATIVSRRSPLTAGPCTAEISCRGVQQRGRPKRTRRGRGRS
ncbi:hypothetical protein EXIGLDRAFT_160058 [Exidia glandulosa HHB12029]|uniref:Uncharacterized protein n=1 Tax=Exidia glandulosa HHB12029 TaxID=1314781 RepID=A0A165FJ15_EXIGL|nr:hypothetical protein EXIGLDRAFT_160058 [Exidia glandulosa HHB12029]